MHLLELMYEDVINKMLPADINMLIQQLSPEEHAKIRPVLERDLEFQRREKARIRLLRTSVELSKSANYFQYPNDEDRMASMSSDSLSSHSQLSMTPSNESTSTKSTRQCKTCSSQLGFIFNAGSRCKKCKMMVCDNCRCWTSSERHTWFCSVCYQERELAAASNEWFFHSPEEPSNVSEVLLLHMRRATLINRRKFESTNAMELNTDARKFQRNRMNSLPFAFPPIPKECLLQVPKEHGYEPELRSIRQRRSRPGDSIDEEDISEAESNEPSSEKERYEYRMVVRPRSPTRSYKESYDSCIPEEHEERNQNNDEEDSRPCSGLTMTSSRRSSSECLLDSYDDTATEISTSRPQTSCSVEIQTLDFPTTSKRASCSSVSNATGSMTLTENHSILNPTPHALGQIQLRLIYNFQKGCLEVHVFECRGLPHFGKHYPNTFVQICLLPDDGYSEHSKVRTSIRRRSFNPVYNEILRFPNLTKYELDERYLQIGVWHSESFHTKSLIGECFVKMFDYPWNCLEPIWISLRAYPESVPPDPLHVETSRGTIAFELKFEMKNPKMKIGDIHFLLKSGHNLYGHPPVLARMPFAKVQLLSGRKCLVSARSCLAEFPENGLKPAWDYDVVIQEVNLKKLRKKCLEVSVWDRENASNKRYIGRIRFRISDSRFVEDEPQVLWKRMIQHPDECIFAELGLRG